jgi:hypothetical protein
MPPRGWSTLEAASLDSLRCPSILHHLHQWYQNLCLQHLLRQVKHVVYEYVLVHKASCVYHRNKDMLLCVYDPVLWCIVTWKQDGVFTGIPLAVGLGLGFLLVFAAVVFLFYRRRQIKKQVNSLICWFFSSFSSCTVVSPTSLILGQQIVV